MKLFAKEIIALIHNICIDVQNYMVLILDANLILDDSEGELWRLINKTTFIVDRSTDASPKPCLSQIYNR